ncbi:TauD/TfdA dioxygenase family protein [Candidatus Poriferisodalis sp.]|uniref:TauD/TfdA dioxygenase family protein n=1 Tax=Candidatus Poriferisodalis sp. TaxID=3101277 RepID=UPI003B019962
MRIDVVQTNDYDRIRVEPLTGTIGAEISGVDLRELDDELIAELHDAWMAHKVLFFRDQELTQGQHVAYGKAFGELEIHPFARSVPEHSEILVLESTADSFQAAETWHSDVTFRECPPLGSILMGRIVPPYGGDTCWANMELAYEQLPDDIKSQIEGRYAIHSFVKAFGRSMSESEREEARQKYPDQKHPVVRTHPVTGAKSLFVNRTFTLTIDGMTPDESRALRRRLYAQASEPEFQCRFRWHPGSIAQWDNRCTQHYAVPDHGGLHRRMERVTLLGDRPA